MEKRKPVRDIFGADENYKNIAKKSTYDLFVTEQSGKSKQKSTSRDKIRRGSTYSYISSDSECECNDVASKSPFHKNPRWEKQQSLVIEREKLHEKLLRYETLMLERFKPEGKKSRFKRATWAQKKKLKLHKLLTGKKDLDIEKTKTFLKKLKTKLKTIEENDERGDSDCSYSASDSDLEDSERSSPASDSDNEKGNSRKKGSKKHSRKTNGSTKMNDSSSDDDEDINVFNTKPLGRISRPNPRAKSLVEQSEEYKEKYKKKKLGRHKKSRKSNQQEDDSSDDNDDDNGTSWGKKVDIAKFKSKISVDNSNSFSGIKSEQKRSTKKEIVLNPEGDSVDNSNGSDISDVDDSKRVSMFQRKSSEDADTVISKIPEIQDDELSLGQKLKQKLSLRKKKKSNDKQENSIYDDKLTEEDEQTKKQKKEYKKEQKKKEREEKKELKKLKKEEKKEEKLEKKEQKKLEKEQKKQEKEKKTSNKKKSKREDNNKDSDKQSTVTGSRVPSPSPSSNSSQPASIEEIT